MAEAARYQSPAPNSYASTTELRSIESSSQLCGRCGHCHAVFSNIFYYFFHVDTLISRYENPNAAWELISPLLTSERSQKVGHHYVQHRKVINGMF